MIGPEDLTKNRYSTGAVGKLVGKNYRTINIHRSQGRIVMERDPVSGRWYASKEEVINYIKSAGLWNDAERKNAIYARVSSHDQKRHGDLDRQIGRLAQKAKGAIVYSDVSSGLDAKRKGLSRLIKAVIEHQVDCVYITHKDRLTRFGFEYLETFFESYGTKIIVTEQKEDKNSQEELVEDMMSLLATFSGNLDGVRSSERKELAKQAEEIIIHRPQKREPDGKDKEENPGEGAFSESSSL